MKKILTLICMVALITIHSNAQGLLGKANTSLGKIDATLKKTESVAATLAKTATSVKRTFIELRATTEEFNQTVKVVKGDTEDKRKTVSKEKLTPLKIKKGEIKNLNWIPFIGFEDQLFPSAIIGLAFYKGATTPALEAIIRPIGIRFLSEHENIPISYEIECSEKKYFDKISGHYLYDESKKEVLVNPSIPWNYEALSKIESSTPVTFTFRFFDDGGNKVEKAVTTYFRSITDCLLSYDKTPLHYLSTAYIQEEHPEIDVILREAINTGMISSISGYQANVDLQVAAICRVLHDRGLSYSSITNTVGSGEKMFSQTIRTFASAMKTNQANCIDGTVVFASILRKIGIKTVMVMVPGHCFLGYYRSKDKSDLVFLETTGISYSKYIDEAKAKAKKVTNKVEAEKIITKGYIDLFLKLQELGGSTYSENLKSNNVTLIDVDNLRKDIKPIPF